MKKVLLLLIISLSVMSCHNFDKEAKPVYENMKKLYELSVTKCEIVHRVWRMAIFDKKYALDGSYVSDFNLALKQLQEGEQIQKSDNELRYFRNEISTSIKAIPGTKEKSYDDLISLYTDLMQLSDMAINPSGSLQSYSEDTKRINSEIERKFIEFEARNPNILK